jgi:hypothetical protein
MVMAMAHILSLALFLSHIHLVTARAASRCSQTITALGARDAIRDGPDFIGYIFIGSDPAYCESFHV